MNKNLPHNAAGMTHGMAQASQADPWSALGEEAPLHDAWLLSFVDILTLFLVLLLVLLMLQNRGKDSELVAANVTAEAQMAKKDSQASDKKPLATARPDQHRQPSETRTAKVQKGYQDQLLSLRTPLMREPALIPRVGPKFMLTTFAESAPHQMPANQDPAPTPLARLEPPQATTAGPDNQARELPATDQPQAKAKPVPKPGPAGLNTLPSMSSERFLQELEWEGLSEQLSISRSQQQLRMETKDSVLFAPASADLSPGGHKLLQGLAALLKRHPGAILVEGHADNRPITSGAYPSNWELSAARASSVVRYLIEQGLDAERLRALGYGDTRPKADNDTLEGRAANRRVSLVLELKQESTAIGPQVSGSSQSPLM